MLNDLELRDVRATLPAWIRANGSERMYSILANRAQQHRITFEEAVLDVLRYQLTPDELTLGMALGPEEVNATN